MPYIEMDERRRYEYAIGEIVTKLTPERPGDINYVISSIVWRVLKRKISYANANSIMGVLECLKLELYRRVIGPYEDTKITDPKNGDI